MPKGDVASRTLRRPLERPNAAALQIFGKSGSPALAHLVDLLDALVFTPRERLRLPAPAPAGAGRCYYLD